MINIRRRFTVITLFVLALFCGSIFAFAAYPYHKYKQFDSRLDTNLNQYIVSRKANCAVLVKDLKRSGVEYAYNKNKRLAAASIIKIHILAAALRACHEGKLSLGQKITVNRGDITGGSGAIKGMQVPVSLTLAQLLRLMIGQSDNTASNKVIKLLGFNYINETSRQLGATNTVLRRYMMDFSQRKKGVENYTTAYDVSLILEKIYNKKLYSVEASQFAMNTLKYQKVNDRIPKSSAKTIVAHKTGLNAASCMTVSSRRAALYLCPYPRQ